MRRTTSFVVLMLVATAIRPGHSQQPVPLGLGGLQANTPVTPTTVWGERSEPGTGSVLRAALGGILLGGVGLVVGASAGAAIETSSCGPGGDGLDLCGVAGTLLGGFVGEVFGLALGTHLGNAQRGNFGLDVLTSFAAAAAGSGVVASRDAPDPEPPVIVAAVLLQLASTVAVELLSGRSRALDRDVAVSIKPQRDGRFWLGASVRF